MFTRKAEYASTSKTAMEITNEIGYFIAKDMMPFRTVERPGFLRLMRKAFPLYRVPTRQYFSKTLIPEMYNKVKNETAAKLAQGSSFAATTDIWTSSGGGGEPYLSFTIHFLTPEWELVSRCLETVIFPEDHTADNIREMIENILEEWNIKKEQLVCITTDNASNMQKALVDFSNMWLGCFGHNLNLAISKVLKMKRVDDGVRACRHTVQGFSRSWKRKRSLKAKQKILNLDKKALIHDVVTRWGSTYKMLERFLSQQQAVSAALAGERGAWHLMPKDSDITVMEKACDLLGPLHQFTDGLASETRVTLSAIKPCLDHIQTEILKVCEKDGALVTEMKRVMRADLDSRYTEEAERMMDIACFLDPRFKGEFSEDLENTITVCVEEALKLVEPTPVRVRQEPLDEPSQPSASAAATTSKVSHKTPSLGGLLKKIMATKQQRAEEEGASSTPEEQVR